jgi:hypothetical protein
MDAEEEPTRQQGHPLPTQPLREDLAQTGTPYVLSLSILVHSVLRPKKRISNYFSFSVRKLQ